MLNRFALQRAWSYISYKIIDLSAVFLLACIVLCSCVVHAGDQNSIPGITLTISCTSKSDVANTNTNNNSNTATQTQHKTHNNQVPMQPVAQTVASIKSSLLPDKSFVFNQFGKKKILLGAVCVAYVSAVVSLYSIAYICQHHCPWAHWKDEFTLGKLRKMPEKELADELFDALNNSSAHTDNDEDFLKPLISFMNAVDREIAWHQKFLSLHPWLDYCFIFPKQQEAQQSIANQYERLTYIRKVLVTWLTSYTNDEIRHGSTKKTAY